MKKSANKKVRPKSPTRKTVVLPDDACPSCGATMKETRGTLHTPAVFILEVTGIACVGSGDGVPAGQQDRRTTG